MRFRFSYAIICLTGILIFSIYLRGATDTINYKLYQTNVEHTRLRQQLGNEQIRLEGLINPASLMERVARSDQ
jgi:hypothetical protein